MFVRYRGPWDGFAKIYGNAMRIFVFYNTLRGQYKNGGAADTKRNSKSALFAYAEFTPSDRGVLDVRETR